MLTIFARRPSTARAVASLFLIGALAGCEQTDLGNRSVLEPQAADGTYRWQTNGDDVSYPPDDPAAEAARLRQLDRILALNSACPGGHTVEQREVITVPAVLYDGYRIYYTVQCT